MTTFIRQKCQTRISIDREEDRYVQCISTYKGRSTNYSHIQSLIGRNDRNSGIRSQNSPKMYVNTEVVIAYNIGNGYEVR